MSELEKKVNDWLSTWAPHCGAPRDVFEGQFREVLRSIFDSIEDQAEAQMVKTLKLEGMHCLALRRVREDLRVPERRTC